MPLHDVFRRLRAVLTGAPTDEAAGVPMVPAAEHDAIEAFLTETRRRLAEAETEHDAIRALLIETRRRLAVSDQRLAILEASNRVAGRALRRLLHEREQLVAERDAVEVRLSIALGERAIAVGDQQRTMVLNDHVLSALRDSEAARERLEDENQRLRRRAEGPSSAVPAVEAVGNANPSVV
ncbi:hypothetical protein ABS772_11170 [Methylorubrum podarium]|uniref:ATPase n=1 Tax=Methylorubrum podarium TaxID=200476 RepID=A0ABV1QM57_9HYPH